LFEHRQIPDKEHRFRPRSSQWPEPCFFAGSEDGCLDITSLAMGVSILLPF
jgi:hypothetical protein